MNWLVTFAMVVVFAAGQAGSARADVAGASDHPLVPRFAGSEIIAYKSIDYDEHLVALGPVYEVRMSKRALKKQQVVEGKITQILYRMPAGKSVLQVFRNYEKALKKRKFELMFSCKGNAECGFYAWFREVIPMGKLGIDPSIAGMRGDFRYLAAKLPRKEGDVYVTLVLYRYASSINRAWQDLVFAELTVVELEPMEDEMVVVKAKDLAKRIAAEGHAAVHQILFDTDSDVIKVESKPAIDEIARLLQDNLELGIILVGHTDNQGPLSYNLDLSKRRAAAVKAALIQEYGIAPERLDSAGVGFLAPIASNRTEEGKARNRRVELVERP